MKIMASILAFLLMADAPPAPVAALARIKQFAETEGGKLWPGYESAAFGFLLIDGNRETLFCRDPLPEGFTAVGGDPALPCNAATRDRSQLPGNLLAAMPLFGPPSTIVMGTPGGTGRDPAEWTRTILHEHFHQWQDALPNLYPRMAKLELAGGDQTGMWMLNFAFPYEASVTKAAFKTSSRALADALRARGTPRFRPALDRYLTARSALANAVGPRNWRYAELILWKEGVARWTEIELGKRYPDPAVRGSAEALERRTVEWIGGKADIAAAGREFVYPYGAGEAMLLAACGPGWRKRYPSQLALGPLLANARRTCRVR